MAGLVVVPPSRFLMLFLFQIQVVLQPLLVAELATVQARQKMPYSGGRMVYVPELVRPRKGYQRHRQACRFPMQTMAYPSCLSAFESAKQATTESQSGVQIEPMNLLLHRSSRR